MTGQSRRQAETKRELERRRAVMRAKGNVRKTRAKLLAQGRKLAARKRRNERQAEQRRAEQDRSDGPKSTLPEADGTRTSDPRGSTVPEQPAESDVDPEERLYARRLRRRLGVEE
jgi:hypothetical protein